MTCCPRCGAELAPDGLCRFAVPREEAPWLASESAEKGIDRDRLLPIARWLIHHPDAAEGRIEWARRTAGVEPRVRGFGALIVEPQSRQGD